MSVDPRWYADFFDRDWLDFVALRAPEESAQQQVDFVVEQLELRPGTRVLDLPCGHGRHTLELARRGYDVVGVDLSETSLALAREAAEREGLAVELRHADMREIDFESEFDAVLNLYTSFGYLETTEDDRRVLAKVAQALRPDGRFLIDTVHVYGLMKRYAPQAWHAHDDGSLMLEQRELDPLTGRNNVTWHYVRADGTRGASSHSIRLYTPVELRALLADAGLEPDGFWGGFDGSELTLDTWRVIIRATKR